MAFNLRPFGKVLNVLMYDDTCTISRVQQTTDEYGASRPTSRVDIYTNIKCKFSFKNKDNPSDGNEAYMPVLKQVVVFTDLDHNIKAGDYINGYKRDEKSGVNQLIQGICGEPNRYDTHQEIDIELKKEN